MSKLKIISKRILLNQQIELDIDRKKKGRDGEAYFKSLLDDYLCEGCYVISDYSFSVDQSECQLDFILLYNDTFTIIEVKNYYGDFEMQSDGFYQIQPVAEKRRNPLGQIERAEVLFRQHLKRLNLNFNVNSYVVFVNPEFALYHLTRQMKIILPGQIKRLLKQVSRECYYKNYDYAVSRLEKARLEKSKYEVDIKVDFDEVKKGMTCRCDDGWLKVISHNRAQCDTCDLEYTLEDAVAQSVYEMEIMFPEMRLSARQISEFIGEPCTISKLRRILNRICDTHGATKDRYYTLKDENKPIR